MVPLANAARDDSVLAPEAMIVASGWPPPCRSQNSAMLRPHGLVAPTKRHSPRKSVKERAASSATASGRSSKRSPATHSASSRVTIRPPVTVSSPVCIALPANQGCRRLFHT